MITRSTTSNENGELYMEFFRLVEELRETAEKLAACGDIDLAKFNLFLDQTIDSLLPPTTRRGHDRDRDRDKRFN